MTLVVEDGTGMTTADGYTSAVDFLARVVKYGLAYVNVDDPTGAWIFEKTDEEVEGAIRRGTFYLDGQYHDLWHGARSTAEQALDWPRAGVPGEAAGSSYAALQGAYAAGYYPLMAGALGRPRVRGRYGVISGVVAYPLLSSTTVPERIKAALTFIAVRELFAPGSLQPDFVPSEQLSSITVGPVSMTYRAAGAIGGAPRIAQVEDVLRPLLREGLGSVVALSRG